MDKAEKADKPTKEPFIYFSLRLPPELHADLKRLSAEQERSIHAQVLFCLRQCVARQAAQS